MPLRSKILLCLAIVPIFGAVVGYLQITKVRQVTESFNNISDNDVKRLVILQNTRQLMTEVHYATVTPTDPAGQLSQQRQTYFEYLANDRQNQAVYRPTAQTVFQQAEALIGQTQTKALTASQANQAFANFDSRVSTLIDLEKTGIEAKDKAADNFSRAIVRSYFLVTIASLLIVVGLGFIIALIVRRALQPLRRGAEAFAEGHLSEQVPIYTKDEIGMLAGTFNTMAGTISKSYRRVALEKKRDEAILQGMNEGLVAIDEQNHIVMINALALQLLNLSDKQVSLLGQPLQEIVKFYNLQNQLVLYDQTPIAQALRVHKTVSEVLIMHHDTGRVIQMHVSVSPLVDDGKAVGAVIILRDVTKEREIDRMKTEFISLASHQLRTPLSAIKWFSEMLLSGDAGELKSEQKEFTQSIVDSTARMIELVNALLNISRIESGRIMVEPEPTDIKKLITAIVNDLSAKTNERHQTLVVDVHADLPSINLDPRLIGQVYLNLLSNAIKYTPKGGEISLFVSRRGDELLSQVSDNGYGIPADQQSRIFQKFFRAENVTKIETDGTGLGLYLIKTIIESSGGKIWFDSRENQGTSFWFTIPMSGMQPKKGEVTLD